MLVPMSSIQSSIASYPVYILPIVYIFPSMYTYLPSVYIQTILFLNDSVIIALYCNSTGHFTVLLNYFYNNYDCFAVFKIGSRFIIVLLL